MMFNPKVLSVSFFLAISPTYLLLFWFPDWLGMVATFQLSSLFIFLWQGAMFQRTVNEMNRKLEEATAKLDKMFKDMIDNAEKNDL